MTHSSYLLENLLLENIYAIKKLKTSEQKIKFIEKLLEKNFGKFISRNNISEKLNIKKHRYRYFLDNSFYPQIKIGKKIFIKTSSFAPLVYNDYKKTLEEKYEI